MTAGVLYPPGTIHPRVTFLRQRATTLTLVGERAHIRQHLTLQQSIIVPSGDDNSSTVSEIVSTVVDCKSTVGEMNSTTDAYLSYVADIVSTTACTISTTGDNEPPPRWLVTPPRSLRPTPSIAWIGPKISLPASYVVGESHGRPLLENSKVPFEHSGPRRFTRGINILH